MKTSIKIFIYIQLLLFSVFTIQISGQSIQGISPNHIEFSSTGGTKTFYVNAPGNGWGFSNNDSWLSFSQKSGYGSATISVTCTPKSSTGNQTSTIKIYSTTLTITQYGLSLPATPSTPSVTFNNGSSTLTRGTPPSGVTWYWQTSSNGTSTANGNSTYTVYNSGTYYLRAHNSAGWSTSSASRTVTVTTCPPPENSTTLYCIGEENFINATSLGSGVTDHIWYTTRTGDSHISTNITVENSGYRYVTRYTRPDPFTQNAVYYVSSVCNSIESNRATLSIIVQPKITPSIGISSDPPVIGVGDNNEPIVNVCTGSSLILSSSNSNGGDNPTFQWKKNGSNIPGATSSTFSAPSVTNGDSYSVSMTSNANCLTTKTVSSGVINIVVPVIPSVSLTPTNPSICAGTEIAFVATPHNAENPTYIWKVNGITQSAQTGPSFTTTNLTNDQIVTVEMFSYNPCVFTETKSTSSTVVTVNPINHVRVSISGNNELCDDEHGTFIASGTGGDRYKWYVNQVEITNTGTGSDYIYSPSRLLQTNEEVRCVLSSDEGCSTNNPAVSNIITISRLISSEPDVSITTFPEVISDDGTSSVFQTCRDGNISLTAYPANVSYQWKLNNNNIIGANSQTFSPSEFSNGDYYSVEVSNLKGCFTTNEATVSAKQLRVRELQMPTVEKLVVDDNTAASLIASGAGVNEIYNWYIEPLGGTPLTSTTTPNINEITNYYVSIYNPTTGCESESRAELSIIPASLNQNYIKTTSPKIENTELSGVSDCMIDYAYFDGLGRLIQNIALGQSPGKNDIVQITDYDEYGRQTVKYMPYTTENDGRFISTAIDDYKAFYKSIYSSEDQENFTSVTKFDDSPLNRVVEQGAPGADWQIGAATTYFVYKTDEVDEVPIWDFSYPTSSSEFGEVSSTTFYSSSIEEGKLFITEIWDEENNTVSEYKDKQGQTLLKRTISEDGTLITETHYVYDDFGQLRFVFPPQMMANLGNAVNPVPQDTLDKWAYQYNYDAKSRMIAKKFPGVEPVYMVYDGRDRLVATQDGNMRYYPDRSLRNEWLFTKYDAFDRPILTGITTIVGDQKAVQDLIDAHYNVPESHYFETIGSDVHGYTNVSYPIVSSENDYLTVTYYDDYRNLPSTVFPSTTYSIKSSTVLDDADGDNIPDDYFEKVKGQVVGTKTKVLDGYNTWIKAVNYYDNKYRPIQTIADVYLGSVVGQDVVSTEFDFIGQVMKTEYIHNGNETVSIAKRYVYDHAGRLLKVYHKINTDAEVLMSYIRYNELGEIVEKNLHSSDINATDQNSFLQSVDYRYNIRGWLKSINNSALTNDPTTGNDDTNDLFGFDIMYNDPF